MRTIAKFTVAAAICAATGFVGASPSQAGPMSVAEREIVSQSSPVEQIHYRRYHHHHWRHAHYWRHRHYRYYGYRPWYNPAGAVAGAAVGLATAPFWAFTGYPYWW